MLLQCNRQSVQACGPTCTSSLHRWARHVRHHARHVRLLPSKVAEFTQPHYLAQLWSSQLGNDLSFMSLEGDFQATELRPSLRTPPQLSSQEAATAAYTGAATQPCSTSATSLSNNSLPDHPLQAEVQLLQQIITELQACDSWASKVALLLQQPRVQAFLQARQHQEVANSLPGLPVRAQYVLLAVLAAGQAQVLTLPDTQGQVGPLDLQPPLLHLAQGLQRVDQFYNSIGGLLGYQAKSLTLIIESTVAQQASPQPLLSAERHTASSSSPSRSPSLSISSSSLPSPGSSPSISPSSSSSSLPALLSSSSSSSLPSASAPGEQQVLYHVPRALDLAGEGGRQVGQRMAAHGLLAMPSMAEIYPVGGAGDRLGLVCEDSGQCLPAAMLPYCGRTMMEGLMRDLQAREFLYYKLTGQQVVTPVAIMTSDAKGNHNRITALMQQLRWFGRGRGAFQLFRQPLVPVLGIADGRWLLSRVLQPMSKPGGHGAIWKLMQDEGVFDWMAQQGRSAAIVRQISNPMAGVDTTLLALAGCGAQRGGSAFGFMSCDRTIGAAEGCNVLQERRVWRDGRWQHQLGYTNIEYTEFERLGIYDQPVDGTSRCSVFPANTNVLYVGLGHAQAVVEEAMRQGNSQQLMPGLIFNMKKKVLYRDPLTQHEEQVLAGRMESTMQNIADFMTDSFDGPVPAHDAEQLQLSTFLVYNMRRKVTSSAKKRRQPGSTRISQTPDGSFYDLQRNAWHLLQQCGVAQVPELGSVEQYLTDGPGFIFLFHPALGPLWSVISQKVQGGSLQQGSELVLEVAEARLRNIHIDGSLLVHAENVLGHVQHDAQPEGLDDVSERLVFSPNCGRVLMTNVTIQNAGINWQSPSNVYWKHCVSRYEAVRVVLRGHSEFEARDVTLRGSHTFDVPDGFRLLVTPGFHGEPVQQLLPLPGNQPSWQWEYSLQDDGHISLSLKSTHVKEGECRKLPNLMSTRHLHHAMAHEDQSVRGGEWRLLQQLTDAGVVLDFII
ncbi:hypothetical protein QJQ45_018602 [Haematococcus lacustris]|nr:hypothetical protein QJQ45_018602 [Haematococcus lacustris]